MEEVLIKSKTRHDFVQEIPRDSIESLHHVQFDNNVATSNFSVNRVNHLSCKEYIIHDTATFDECTLVFRNDLRQDTRNPCRNNFADYLIGEVTQTYRAELREGRRIRAFLDD